MNVDLVLYIVAAVCFALASLGVPSRIGLVPLGLLAITLTHLI